MHKLQRDAFAGAVAIIGSGAHAALLAGEGVTQAAFDRYTGDTPWLGVHRSAVQRTHDAILYTSLDVLGVPRISLPAEYIVGAIASFVHAVNLQTACRWFAAGTRPAEYYVAGEQGESEPTTAERLFAFLITAYDTDHSEAFDRKWVKSTGLSISRAAKADQPAPEVPEGAD